MDYYDSGAYDAAAAGIGIGLTIMFIFFAVLGVVCIIGMWRIFEKADEPGWAALIPFYNTFVLFKIAWGSGVYFFLLFIPAANVIVSIILSIKLARAFGQGDGFAIGLIFLPFIFYLVLAFGKSRYIGPDGNPSTPTYVINQYNYNGAGDGQAAANQLRQSLDAVNNNAAGYPEPAAQPEPVMPASLEQDKKFCMNCGAVISSTAKFCKHCGSPVAQLPPQKEEPVFEEPSYREPEPEQSLLDATADLDDLDRTEILIDEPVNLGPHMRMTRIDDGTGTEDEFDVLGLPFVVGRSATEVDHEIGARGVSRKHMQIDFQDDSFYVTDLNSTNGVFVNDSRIPTMEQTLVANGDIIRIGQSEYSVEISEE